MEENLEKKLERANLKIDKLENQLVDKELENALLHLFMRSFEKGAPSNIS